MNSIITLPQITILFGGIGTFAVFSFLWKENRFYRFFEHLFVGVSASFWSLYTVKNLLWPKVLMPMLGLNIDVYPDGTLSAPYNPYNLFFLLPLLFGALYYTIFSSRFSWLSRLVIGFSMGLAAGASFEGIMTGITPQVLSSFKPLIVASSTGGIDYLKSLDAIVYVTTLLSVLYYFFFSFGREGRLPNIVRGYGRILMMLCFGAFFGSTVMARMALLVERLQFLVDQWWVTLRHIIF